MYNKTILVLGLIVIIVAVLFLVWQFSSIRLKKEAEYKTGKICINSNCFDVQIAENNFAREKGLMFRESMGENTGMLFTFDEEANYPFWMKNTKIKLDIIWINEKSEIIYIAQFAQPCTTFFCPQIDPKVPAKYVLEINAGLAEKYNIKIGDKVEINY